MTSRVRSCLIVASSAGLAAREAIVLAAALLPTGLLASWIRFISAGRAASATSSLQSGVSARQATASAASSFPLALS